MKVTRRSVLQLGGTALALPFTGCSSDADTGYDRGTLVIENQHRVGHFLRVSVVGGPAEFTTKEGETGPVPAVQNGLTGQFAIDTGQTRTYPDFLTLPVIYEVEVQVDNREPKRRSFNPQSAGDGTTRGMYLTCRIDKNGEFHYILAATE